MARTSKTHPLEIAAVRANPEYGRIGITFCPGKHDDLAMTGTWARDLSVDIDVIAKWGARLVLTLIEPAEMEALRVSDLGSEVKRRGMDWRHLPIGDYSVPTPAFERQWEEHSEIIRDMLRSGYDIVVHCKGGLGRAGMIAARLLVELGVSPEQAISEVRHARKGAIETSAQAELVRRTKAIPERRPAGGEKVMDWFERLTGFREAGYDKTRSRLAVDGDVLQSLVNGKRYGIGTLELVSLAELRERVKLESVEPGQLKVRVAVGDVRQMHRTPENAGALFQVASQFNLLEMVGPDVTPEDGVTRYQHDHTQGPACAIAAGAATIYRNYFAPIGGEAGQTAKRQLDGLADLGAALSTALSCSVAELWQMKNGYALCTPAGLKRIGNYLLGLDGNTLNLLRGKLRIGLHSDVEVTDTDQSKRTAASQAFCSALPVAYSNVPAASWAPFARFVLEAAYEATVLSGFLNAARGRSNRVLLTSVGGGAFGNHESWINDAIIRALELAKNTNFNISLVSFGSPSPGFLKIARQFASSDA